VGWYSYLFIWVKLAFYFLLLVKELGVGTVIEQNTYILEFHYLFFIWLLALYGTVALNWANTAACPHRKPLMKGVRCRIFRAQRLRPPSFRKLYRRSYPWRLRKHGIYTGRLPPFKLQENPCCPSLPPPSKLAENHAPYCGGCQPCRESPKFPTLFSRFGKLRSFFSCPPTHSCVSHGRCSTPCQSSTTLLAHALCIGAIFQSSPGLRVPESWWCADTKDLSELAFDPKHAALKTSLTNSENQFAFVWDTGASKPITFDKADFISPLVRLKKPLYLNGFSAGTTVEYEEGVVKWLVPADDGSLWPLIFRAYYAPKANLRLLSIQHYMQTCKQSGPFHADVTADRIVLSWKTGPSLTVPYHPRNNLPIGYGYKATTVNSQENSLHLCVSDEANQNLHEAQKELLRWHFRLGHLNFDSIRLLLRSGVLASSEGEKALHRAAAKCELPQCASCQFGKAKRRPTPSSTTTVNSSNDGVLKQGNLLPGQQVSVDHFVCGTKGRLYTSKGKTRAETMYSGGCIFSDHASGLVHIEHQVALMSHETLQSKHKFEAASRDSGVIIQTYRSDNGSAFSAGDYAKELATFKQISIFAGVGAHHHNGVAERSIQTIMSMACTMMLHTAIRWPDPADSSLWPMAVDYTVYIHNHMPNQKSGLSPIDLFSGTKWPSHKCRNLHVWGSPTYVLDSAMQDGKKLPRWTPRSRRAIFVGLLNSKHAGSQSEDWVHQPPVSLCLRLLVHHG
jgi:GAG-pre-integrase domain